MLASLLIVVLRTSRHEREGVEELAPRKEEGTPPNHSPAPTVVTAEPDS